MATFFGQMQVGQSLTQSDYYNTIESVAPGFAGIVESQRKPSENWWDVAQRMIPFLDMTTEQRVLLNSEVQYARAGEPAGVLTLNGQPVNSMTTVQPAGVPPAYSYTPDEIVRAAQQVQADKPDLTRIIAWGGALVTVANWL